MQTFSVDGWLYQKVLSQLYVKKHPFTCTHMCRNTVTQTDTNVYTQCIYTAKAVAGSVFELMTLLYQ